MRGGRRPSGSSGCRCRADGGAIAGTVPGAIIGGLLGYFGGEKVGGRFVDGSPPHWQQVGYVEKIEGPRPLRFQQIVSWAGKRLRHTEPVSVTTNVSPKNIPAVFSLTAGLGSTTKVFPGTIT